METSSFYSLMHKDIEVCKILIDENNAISNIQYIEANKDHIPVGARLNNNKFKEWWLDRAIPKTRHGVKTALEKLGYKTTENALVNNLALSLTDCYWIRPLNSNIKWSDVSLFTNDFVDEIGEITLNHDKNINLKKKTKFSLATSQGELQKKWCIDKDGKRFMVKGNYGLSYQQSLNEIFATNIHKQFGFQNFTEYFLVDLETSNNNQGLGVISYDFCNENTEFVSAWELLQMQKRKASDSLFECFKKSCLSIGIKEKQFNDFMDYMIMTDFLLSNIDRHMNNFGILRNPDTLKVYGFAPLYDTGNSMFYNMNYDSLKTLDITNIKTNCFIDKEIKLLKYVCNRNIIDLNKLNISFEIYKKDIAEYQIRIPELERLFEKKIDLLKKFQSGKNIWEYVYLKNNRLK